VTQTDDLRPAETRSIEGITGAFRSRDYLCDRSLATAVFVPVAVLAIWWVVRRIRRRHIAGDK